MIPLALADYGPESLQLRPTPLIRHLRVYSQASKSSLVRFVCYHFNSIVSGSHGGDLEMVLVGNSHKKYVTY